MNSRFMPPATKPMEDAPRDATWIVLWYAKGISIHPIAAHWAEDLNGEEQPPFRGWFRWGGYGFTQCSDNPVGWTSIEGVWK